MGKTIDKMYQDFLDKAGQRINALEELRIASRKKNQKVLQVSVPVFVVGSLLFIWGVNEGYMLWYKLLSVSLAIAAVGYTVFKVDGSYNRRIKSEVIPVIVKVFDSSIKFKEKEYEYDFKMEHKLLSIDSINQIKITDTLNGNYKEVRFKIGEVKAYTSGGKNNSKMLTFAGFYGVFNFNKKFSGTTVVLDDSILTPLAYGSSFGNIFYKENKVDLEDSRFEKRFDIYSSDQVEARYILSTAFMERIQKLEEHFDGWVNLLFKDNKMHIAIRSNHNFFEVKSRESLKDINTIKKYLCETEFLLGIVDILKLNEKLWSKR